MSVNSDDAPKLSDNELAGLASAPLPYLRSSRSLGQERAIELADLSPADSVAVRRIYDLLQRLDPGTHRDIPGEAEGQEGPSAVDSRELRGLLSSLGTQSVEPRSEYAREVLHDVRSGASAALVGALKLKRAGTAPLDDVFAVRLLARDHRKLMRSAIRDLDPDARAHDLTFRPHSAAQLVRGLRAVDRFREGLAVTVDCRFDGMVSACCLELGALERVLYNMVNNACRHATGSVVVIHLLPAASTTGQDARIVVVNLVSEMHALVLENRFGHDLTGLFRGEFSSNGSGLGLHTCAELVADAYGMPSSASAVRAGHLGARLFGLTFAAWFHWPAVGGSAQTGSGHQE